MQNRIKVLRKKRGLTMHALARKVGTSQQQIDRLEKGKRRLTVEWIENLSSALDCQILDLLPFSDREANAQSTARAKVIGMIDSKNGNVLESFVERDMYSLIFGRCRNVQHPKLFGLVVKADGLADFPDGTELIFTEIDSKTKVQKGKLVVLAKKSGGYYIDKAPAPAGDTIKAVLVKSIREE